MLTKMDELNKANVFATDDVLSTLMVASRSFYSWDIMVTKRNGKIYFDKREDGVIGENNTGFVFFCASGLTLDTCRLSYG